MKKGSIDHLNWFEKYNYEKDIPFTAKDLKCEGTKFQIVKFKPGHKIKPHFHKQTSEIFFIYQGNGILKLNNQEFECKSGDFFLCEPKDVHEFINNTKKEFTILIFKTNEIKDKDMHWV